MTRADFVTGLVFMALGGAALAASLAMPRFENRDVEPFTVPGLVPGILALVILVLGGVLAGRAARQGGWRLSRRETPAGIGAEWRRLTLALVLCLGYAAGLVGTLPFWLATLLFVSAFVMVFTWAAGRSHTEHLRAAALAMAFGAAVTVTVTFVFQEIFLVRLP